MFGSARLINLASLALFKTSSVNVDRDLKSIFCGVRCDDATCVCGVYSHISCPYDYNSNLFKHVQYIH